MKLELEAKAFIVSLWVLVCRLPNQTIIYTADPDAASIIDESGSASEVEFSFYVTSHNMFFRPRFASRLKWI